MGIPKQSRLWPLIRDAGEAKSIATWSSEHYRKTGRPLRIAVDEPCWRYANLTEAQAQKIHRDSEGAQPIERDIMFRLFRLMVLNIQFIFIFDGPRKFKPGNNTRQTALLKQLLDHLHVPWYQAPAEAEAECAKLNEIGVVDAVWSADADVLMFGAKILVKFHKTPGTKNHSKDEVLVYDVEKVEKMTGFGKQSIVLFAVLAGCDYLDGLKHCGGAKARLLAAHDRHGLAEWLWDADFGNIRDWRRRLQRESGLPVPDSFPPMSALNRCLRPIVSDERTMRNLPCLKNGWFWRYGNELSSTWFFLCRIFNRRVAKSWPLEHLACIEANYLLQSCQYRNKGQIRLKQKRKEGGTRGVEIRAADILTELKSVADYWDIPATGDLQGIDWTEFGEKVDWATGWARPELDMIFEAQRNKIWPNLQDIKVSGRLLEAVLDHLDSPASGPKTTIKPSAPPPSRAAFSTLSSNHLPSALVKQLHQPTKRGLSSSTETPPNKRPRLPNLNSTKDNQVRRASGSSFLGATTKSVCDRNTKTTMPENAVVIDLTDD